MEVELLSLKEIEGVQSPHDGQLKHAADQRAEAFKFVEDPEELAAFIGGEVVKLGRGEDWGVRKEVFPEVFIYFLFERGDEELPPSLRVLFGGGKVREIPGEDLKILAVACLNHMLRFIRRKKPSSGLPPICFRV